MNRFLIILICGIALLPQVASAIVVTESYDSWIRDEGLTLGDRDGDWLGVYNSTAGGGLARWSVLEFDLSGLAPLTVSDVQMGFWHMFAGSPVSSSDADPSRQTVSVINEISGTTATPNFTWNQLNNPGQVTLTEFESLGALDLAGLLADPSEADRYHYGAGSATDIALIQSIVDAGGMLRVVVRSDESVSTNLRVDWGDGPNDGDAGHGQSAILLINETPPETNVELTIEINRLTGGILMKNPGVDPTVNTTFEIDGYVLETSAAQPALRPAHFTGLSGAGEPGWQTVGLTSSALSEVNLFSSTVFEEGDETFLGFGFTPGASADPTMIFNYSVAGRGLKEGRVVFIEQPTGDFNFDTFVNLLDYGILRDHMQAHLDGIVGYAHGDMDLDGDVDLDDFGKFKAVYPGGSAALARALGQGSVPEPANLLLVLSGLASFVTTRRRSSRRPKINARAPRQRSRGGLWQLNEIPMDGWF